MHAGCIPSAVQVLTILLSTAIIICTNSSPHEVFFFFPLVDKNFSMSGKNGREGESGK